MSDPVSQGDLFIGLMSGTSLDGVDAAVLQRHDDQFFRVCPLGEHDRRRRVGQLAILPRNRGHEADARRPRSVEHGLGSSRISFNFPLRRGIVVAGMLAAGLDRRAPARN